MAETYFGKICAKHPELKGERYASDRKCTACQKARYQANPEKVKARRKAWYKAWREANPDNLQLLKPVVNLRKGDKEIHPLFLRQLEDQT